MSTDLIPVPHDADWLLVLSCGHLMLPPWREAPFLPVVALGWHLNCQQCDLRTAVVTGWWRMPHGG